MLPFDRQPWQIVYYYFDQWRLDGTWQAKQDLLRSDVWAAACNPRQASAGMIDSKSVGDGRMRVRRPDAGK
jgi:hypothetical protein